jgi:hypothetical protein
MTQEEKASSATREDKREKVLHDEWLKWRKNKKRVWYLC